MIALLRSLLLALVSLLAIPTAEAVTYVNAATTFNWIDATAHTKVGAHTVPYQFKSLGGCGTSWPIIDDTISDIIPIGFNFVFGDKVFDSVRIMSNGRIHLVSTTLPLDNTTCGFGSPVTQLPYPDANLNYTMRIYGNDMDPTLLADYGGSSTPCASNVGANACFVSIATIGTAPNRQFVVTWNNVPEWTTFSSATGNYNLQMLLNENGDFIYQYGNDVAGPQAALGQVGWQLSNADYDTPALGYPVPNTAIRFFIPHPVVEYLMEQPSWSGSGTALDTSGNGRNGSPVGLAQTVPAGKVCRGATLPAAGLNAIDSGVSVPSTIGNSGTIAFWYKANTAWSGAGTQDALLLDATTLNNQWFFLVRRGGLPGSGGGRLRFVITDSLGTAQIVETAAIAVAANTWKHIAITWSFNNLTGGNNDRLTVFVDGVQQQQTAFTSTTATLSSQIGSLYIGGSRNSLVGPSGTANSADATLDEFRAYNYEAKLAFISTIMNQASSVCLHHYAISDAGTGVSCRLSQFAITAHTVSHTAFVNNALATLSTSDGTGTWSLLNGLGILTNLGSNTGNATYSYNNETQVLLGLTHPTAATVTAHVTDGTYTESENTPLVISNCAVGKFNACEVAASRCTPAPLPSTYANLFTKLADTAFALDLVAVKANGTLDTTFVKSVAVNLLANTLAPTSFAANNCPTSQVATIPLGSITFSVPGGGRPPVGGVNVAAAAFSSVSPNYSAYGDVRVQFVCTPANCGGGSGTWCATDGFSVRPQSLAISSSASADASGASTTSAPTVKAGASFTLTANGATVGYNGTPNIDATKAEWVSPPAGGRAASGAGTVAGSFTTAATLANGNGASGTSFTYDEVGYFHFKAGGVYDVSYAGISGDVGNGDCINTPPNDYSNALIGGKYGCKIANQIATNYFGRFIPDHFAVTGPVLTQGCIAGAFTYMDQPFSLTASIEAQNSSFAKTQNYSGGFAKGTISAQAENANNGTALGTRLTIVAPWSNGAAAFTGTKFSRPVTAAPGPTWGPYDTLSIGAVVTDADSLFLINRNMDEANATCTADGAGTSNGTCTAVTLASTKLRYGRVKMQNAYGSELLNLPMPFALEFWNGNGWINNGIDSCTSMASSNFGFVFPVGTVPKPNNMAACKTALTVAGGAPAYSLSLSRPGTGNSGWSDLTLNLGALALPGNTQCVAVGGAGAADVPANMPWLQYNWTGAGNANPRARATFGVYKSPLIYRRENY